MAQKLKFGNGTWATKKGSTLAYNDENNNYKPLPFTTTRNSIGTRVNKEGLIEVVGNDIPRIDYTDSTDGVLLLEPTSTNFIQYSENFSASGWINAGGVTLTDNYGIAPNGTITSTRIVFSDTNKRFYYNGSDGQSNDSISIYVKGTSGETISFAKGASIGTSQVFTLNGAWQRLTHTYDGLTASERNVIISTNAGATARNIEVWGCQNEYISYATSYIPTSGSTITRQVDTASGSGNSEVFNDSEGVLFADISALTQNIGTVDEVISISDGSLDNRVRIYHKKNLSNTIAYGIESNNVGQFFTTIQISDITLQHKTAFKYKVNDCSLWVNGFEIDTQTSVVMPTGLSNLSYKAANNTSQFYGKTKEIGYYDEILTDAELEKLTSYRSLSELVTELNLNAL